MEKHTKRCLLTGILILLILIITAGIGNAMYKHVDGIQRGEAEHILHFYKENILNQFQNSLNEASSLARTAYTKVGEDPGWFEKEAESLLKREEIRYVCLIEGDIVVSVFPEEVYGSQTGKELKELSYIYTLAKVVKDFVAEGPVTIQNGGDQVFLFLQPFLEGDAYLGEVVVALDKDYVIGQLGLDYLSEQGYDYELWRVEPQNGEKDIVAVSNEENDFSNAEKITFELPIPWNLSIQPQGGWINSEQRGRIISVCMMIAFAMLGGSCLLDKLLVRGRTLKRLSYVDSETGIYSRKGFLAQLDKWMKDESPVNLFYFVFEGYNQISQRIDSAEKSAFLSSIPVKLKEFIQSPYIAGRLGEGNFAVAVREDMNELQQEDFAKGVSLELFLKIRLDGERVFLNAGYEYKHCLKGEHGAAEELSAIIQKYYARRSKESPARMLTEKCRQLIEGRSDVVFDEYTDLDMMELSKTFNQYRKQVEQLVYFDPVFNVGNRPRYFRDTNLLISYDKKRRFHLFCVDICAFSQYNQIFSADVGDEILREVVLRLSRMFGSYLYRINGDVFLGISLTDEKEEMIAERLHTSLSVPANAGSASFALQVKVAVCRYPDNGCSAEMLLDSIQSALRYAKKSDKRVVFYNDSLDVLLRTESDIIHMLKSAIREKQLEVWYQPMVYVETGHFDVTEALVRLSDGKGGYFSAEQVVALAERNGMVEQLGDYVLQRACEFMKAHGEELGLKHMNVNISVQQLLVGESADHLIRIINAAGIGVGQITLEITESVLIQSIEHTVITLNRLRENGIYIALDDFGVGYSSLNYLSNLPVDAIKIDRSLISQIRTSDKQHALLKSIVEMADINKLDVVCEGVETEEEMELISASGSDYIQGYYYARPMRKEDLIPFLKTKSKEK